MTTMATHAHAGPSSGATRARPRLLYVYNDPAFFLSYRLRIALAAAAAGYEIHVAAPDGPGTAAIRGHGLPLHCFPLTRRGALPWQELQSVGALAALYRRLRPDLIEHATIKPVIYGSLAARFAGVPPVVNHVTGLGYVFADTRLRTSVVRAAVVAAYRLALRLPRLRVVFENPDNLALFVRRGIVDAAATVRIKGGGTDVEHFVESPEPAGIPQVVLPARMLWHKGVADFVKAAGQLADEGVRVKLVLAGDTDSGNPGAIPRQQLEAWQAQGIVEWRGHCVDMREAYAASAIVCLPSRYGEGVPRALIEGAASGRPLVTTDTAGCRDIVRDGINGICVPPNDPGALAAAIRRLVVDPELRRRMGRQGREIAESEYSLRGVTMQTLELYEELLSMRWAK